MHDTRCRIICSDNPNMTIPWFLMACYAYEKLDDPIISDECFDHISETMLRLYPHLSHWHKSLIKYEPEGCFKGSSVLVNWRNFPTRIMGATHRLLQELRS